MAQYTTTSYANNSYFIDKTGSVTLIASAQAVLTGKSIVRTDYDPKSANYNGAFQTGRLSFDENNLFIAEFPHAESYRKKRLIKNSGSQYYVRSKSTSVNPTYIVYGAFAFGTSQFSASYDISRLGFWYGAWPQGIISYNLNNLIFNAYNNVAVTNNLLDSRFHIVAAVEEAYERIARGTPDTDYTFVGSLTIDSHLGQNPPKSVQIYEDVIITPGSLSPSAGFLNENIVNRFSWAIIYDPTNVGSVIGQNSAIFQWRIKNTTSINTVNVGTEQFVDIPANTFPNTEIEWRIQVTSDDNITSVFSNWLTLTTIDAIPDKPIGLFPNSGTRDGTREIQFSWIYRNSLSTPQFAFELQTTYDNGQTWNNLTGKVESDISQYLAAPNSIIPTNATGQVGWRVRTYNTDNVASPWSDTVFIIVHAAPQTPNWISVETGRSRPLCRWISLGQVGFQITVNFGDTIIFDTGETYGINTEYRIPEFLRNGTYTFRLRIKNIRKMWSEWADFPVSINARQTLTISLNGEPIKDGARLTFEADVR